MKEMEQQDFFDQSFEGFDAKDLNLSKKSYENCTLSGCTFTNADLTETSFISCTFTDCDLTMPKVNAARLQQITFVQCRIQGIDFRNCHQLFLSLGFQKCSIARCGFSDMDLTGTDFTECSFAYTDFFKSNLTSAVFNGSEFKECIMENAILCNADFRNARGYMIDPSKNMISKAKFSLPEAVSLLRYLDIELE